MFLGIIMDIIIIVLMVLSIIVLYNLLLVSIEKKTYEMGVIRMLGLKKKNITFIVITQSLLFVLPGIMLGLLLSIPGMVLVNE
jgi:ABC-type antimicrobial peptide transport system permease subunit